MYTLRDLFEQTIEQLEFTLCIKEKINKIPNKKQSKFNKDKYTLLQINT